MRKLALLLLVACGGSTSPASPGDLDSASDAGRGDADSKVDVDGDVDGSASGCASAASTTATSVTSPTGCAVLERDRSACDAERKAAGLDGFWLKFSCRVKLVVGDGYVDAQSDGLPDYKSNYFLSTDACYESYPGANPNHIASYAYQVRFPRTPSGVSAKMNGGTVGLALNGVPIFSNAAAPGDDIFLEAKTFDRCAAHPQMSGYYHYHSEPFAISYDDPNFIGVMRDGIPVYGRRDSDGSMPALDENGGHEGVTADSPSTPLYHYHVNEQTSTAPSSVGETQWFLTKGTYKSAPATCPACAIR